MMLYGTETKPSDMFNQPKYRLELFKALHPEATDITEVESRASPSAM